jgi:uncharacterized protein YjiS (DUF1127 family)
MTHSDFDCDSTTTLGRDADRHFVLRWFARLVARRRRAATRARLDVLDDHMLRDVGLGRDQITGKVGRHPQFHHGPIFRRDAADQMAAAPK